MNNKKVAIIIVNFNGKEFIKKCLDSVFKQSYTYFDIYFIDNGSSDNSIEFVKKNYSNSKLKIIKLNKNYGFAKGNNIGIKEAFKDKKVKYIVCLNNDTIVNRNWLKELVKTAEKDKKIGAVGSKIIFLNKKNKINSLGIIPLPNGNGINYGKNQKSILYKKEEIIFGPCAAAALYKREVLEKIGLFDEKYFCYLEDVDLAYRINLAGYISVLNPKSWLYHVHSGTSIKMGSFKSYLIIRNSMYNILKYLKLSYLLIYPYLSYKLYQKIKIRFNIQKKEDENLKIQFIINVFKSYFSIFSMISYFLKERKRIKNYIQVIDAVEKEKIYKKFILDYK